MSPTCTAKLPLTCHCCKDDFNPPNKNYSKQHLLNNRPFCHRCRLVYRSLWQKTVLNCKIKLKIVYERYIDNENLAYLTSEFSNIIIEDLKRNLYNGDRQSNPTQVEEYYVFERMTPLVLKIPLFRYSIIGLEDYYRCFNQFYCNSRVICDRVMRYFNLEHEIGISSNGEERDSSIGSEDEKSNGPKKDTFSTVYNNLEWMQMKRLYNIFQGCIHFGKRQFTMVSHNHLKLKSAIYNYFS